MEQRKQTGSVQLSDALEADSFPLPTSYIPWIPFIALLQLIAAIAIAASVVAPSTEHEQVIAVIQNSSGVQQRA
jgi:hypothetical protein